MNLQVCTYQEENKHSTRKHMLIWVATRDERTARFPASWFARVVPLESSLFPVRSATKCRSRVNLPESLCFALSKITPTVYPRYITAPRFTRSSKHSIFAEDPPFPRGVSSETKTYSPLQETGRISRPFHSTCRNSPFDKPKIEKHVEAREGGDLANNLVKPCGRTF